MNKEKTISVVVCTYNGEKHIGEQIDSILRQTYPISEIIVQDDGSSDNTIVIVERYAQKDSRIRVYRKEGPRDVNVNFITAFDKATSDYIAWSDQDDIWLPFKLEKQMECMQASQSWVCFHPTYPFAGETVPKHLIYDHRIPNYGLERTLFLGAVCGHTMLFTKKFHDFIRQHIPESLLFTNKSFYYDSMMSIVANAYGKMSCIVEPLVLHRRLPSSVTNDIKKNLSKRSLLNALLTIMRDLNPRMRRYVRPRIAKRFKDLITITSYFTDATHVENARRIVQAYTSRNLFRGFLFTKELIRNRNRIFYAQEKNPFVAVCRALLFNITMYDYFYSGYLKRVDKQRTA